MKITTDEQGKLTQRELVVAGRAYEVIVLGRYNNNRNDLQAINDRGQMAGVSMNATTGRVEAFREESGMRTHLGTLGGLFSIARDINNCGEIVGGSLTEGDEVFHGFIFRDNRLFDLNELLDPDCGWELIQACAINNLGEIIAIGSKGDEDHIVRLRPRT